MQPDEPLVLAFDTSAAHCAAALLAGDVVLASARETMSKGQAERLFPLLEETLIKAGKSWDDLDAIGVGIGPGNFTGIRISVSAGRGLALGLGIPVIGISTFEALAANTTRPVLVCLDAKQERLYVQHFNQDSALPELLDYSRVQALDVDPATKVIGFRSDEIAKALGCIRESEAQLPAAEDIAKLTRSRLDQDNRAPAPMYLRAADAALPATPPPEILHET